MKPPAVNKAIRITKASAPNAAPQRSILIVKQRPAPHVVPSKGGKDGGGRLV